MYVMAQLSAAVPITLCKPITSQHMTPDYPVLKGRVHGLAHAHESECCFSPVLVVASMQAILFHNIVKEPIRSE